MGAPGGREPPASKGQGTRPMPAGTQIVASAEAVHLHGAHGGTDMLFMLLVAFMLSYAVLDAACRVRAAHGTGRTAWLVGGSLVVGLGIFAFHFIALLSVGLPLPITEIGRASCRERV